MGDKKRGMGEKRHPFAAGLDGGLGERLALVRSRLGTKKRAGEIAGVSAEQWSKWEAQLSKWSFQGVALACVAAEVSIDWLATGQGQPEGVEIGAESALDIGLLSAVVGGVEKYLDAQGLIVAPDKKARLFIIIYQELKRRGRTAPDGPEIDLTEFDNVFRLAS